MSPETQSPTTPIRENPEPTAAATPAPIWLFVLLAVLIYWGLGHLDRHSGGFQALVYEPYSSLKMVESFRSEPGIDPRGKLLYDVACLVCHQANGLGTPGQFPPLAGSEWVIAEGPNRLVRIVLSGVTGPITVKGIAWNATMPPMGESLQWKDDEVAAVVNYIRKAWGHDASTVTPEQVAAVRREDPGRMEPWTADQLLALPEGP
jgi:mono/diheme cytochrome c family protein